MIQIHTKFVAFPFV